MTFSVFDGTGNLIDAFTERTAAIDCLARELDLDVFLVVQDDESLVKMEFVSS